MKQQLAELIDVEKTQEILARFLDAVGIPAAIIDMEGKVLVTSRWRRICTDFHRVNEITCKRCIESDTILANALLQGKSFSLYRCLNGLTDAASPIVIEGEHLANAFIGQFLIEKPDMDLFSRQADECGFDKSDYFRALSEVPILARDTLPSVLAFLTSFAEMIASLGLKQSRQVEIEKELQRAGEALRIQNEELSASEEELRAQNAELLLSREQIEGLARFPSENPNPVMRIAAEGRVLYANAGAERLLADSGADRNRAVPPFWLSMVTEAFSTGSSAILDARVQDRIFSLTVVPVLDKDYVNIYATDRSGSAHSTVFPIWSPFWTPSTGLSGLTARWPGALDWIPNSVSACIVTNAFMVCLWRRCFARMPEHSWTGASTLPKCMRNVSAAIFWSARPRCATNTAPLWARCMSRVISPSASIWKKSCASRVMNWR
ncbi:MAG: PocR ligand-binding domain-containing protein [Syntrophobacteraceae bacterium]